MPKTTTKLAPLAASAALLLPAFAAAGGLPPPITEAGSGAVQCYAPDPAKKRCESIGAYAAGPDGAILNTATALLSSSPPLIMTTVSPVVVENAQVCGTLGEPDIDRATFVVEGKPANPSQTLRLQQAVKTALQSMLGKRICTAYEPASEGALQTKVSVDGAPRPDIVRKVAWVKPADGYRVGP